METKTKTSSNEYLKRIGNYFKNCIDTRGFSNYPKEMTTIQKFDAVMTEFSSYCNDFHGVNQHEFAEWLRGLPSIMTIEFMDSEIIPLAEKLADTKFDEKKHDAIIENYFDFMSVKFFQVYKKLQKNNDFLEG